MEWCGLSSILGYIYALNEYNVVIKIQARVALNYVLYFVSV